MHSSATDARPEAPWLRIRRLANPAAEKLPLPAYPVELGDDDLNALDQDHKIQNGWRLSRINQCFSQLIRRIRLLQSNHSVRDIFAGIPYAGIFASTKYRFFKWNLRPLLPNHGAQGDQRWKYDLS
jgi:hypothetical protein